MVVVKGIVFNLLEHVAVDRYGEDAWDDILARSKLVGAYTSLGSYPDDQFRRLIDAASAALDLPADDVIRWFGRSAIPLLAETYPALFTPHSQTLEFLLTLNDIIHPEVRKLYPGADVPEFQMDVGDDGSLTIGYGSRRKLCAFAEGLIQGAADHYTERVVIEQPRCMRRGDETCQIRVAFS